LKTNHRSGYNIFRRICGLPVHPLSDPSLHIVDGISHTVCAFRKLICLWPSSSGEIPGIHVI
jgi:hypothetical protein